MRQLEDEVFSAITERNPSPANDPPSSSTNHFTIKAVLPSPSDNSAAPDNSVPPADASSEQAGQVVAPKLITRAFTLRREDVAGIESVKHEEGLLSDSAALRRLIRDGQQFRASKNGKSER